MAEYLVWRLGGRARNGADREGGVRMHALPIGSDAFSTALCGAKPGRQSAGWTDDSRHTEVTCPRCLRKMAGEAGQ